MNKYNTRKFAAYFFGFFCAWPVFVDLATLDIIAIKSKENFVTAEIVGGVPVPIGFFALMLFLLFFGFTKKKFFAACPKLILQFSILIMLFYNIGLLKVFSLFAPILSLFALGAMPRYSEEVNFFSIGFLGGVIIFYALNVFSWLFYSFVLGGFGPINFSYQVFGYEIYQFFVSYSAVASLIFGVSSLLLLANGRELRYSKFKFLILAILSGVVVLLAERKAALVDVFFVALLVVAYVFSSLSSGKVNKSFIILPFVVVFSCLFYDVMGLANYHWIENALRQRFPAYLIFYQELCSLDVIGFLFGYRGGFGGYSNLFIDLFARGGIVGVLFYMYILVSAVSGFYRSSLDFRQVSIRYSCSIYRFVLIFIVFNAVVGSMVNLNLVVPYYFVNLVAILAVLATAFTSRGFNS